jgi:hypothetical protein
MKIMNKHKLDPNEFEMDEIESIELIGDELTIDITVEDTHMFFANGIYTHNSGQDQDILQANNVADSYRKIMTGDFILSLSRKMEDKTEGIGRIHVIKNRFGADGMTFPCTFDASCGNVQIYDKATSEGLQLLSKMEKGDSSVKKLTKGLWDSMMDDDGDGGN